MEFSEVHVGGRGDELFTSEICIPPIALERV